MNKKIIKMLSEPEESFESWAKKHNVVVATSGEKKKKKNTFQRWVLSAASAMLIFAAILPFALSSVDLAAPPATPPVTETPAPPVTETPEPPIIEPPIEIPKGKSYSANDVENLPVSLQDLLAIPQAVLFDANLIIDHDRINKDSPLEDESLDLAYNIFTCLISDLETYAFVIDYTVRVYEKYEFSGIQNFSGLEKETVIGDVLVNYTISESVKRNIVLATFRIGTYDYYIRAEGYEGVTDLTEDNFIFLLQLMLTK